MGWFYYIKYKVQETEVISRLLYTFLITNYSEVWSDRTFTFSQYIFIVFPELRYHEFKKYLSNHILKNPRKVAHWKIAPRKIAPHPKPDPRPNPNPREDFVGGNLPGDNFPVTILKLCKAPNQSIINNIIMFFLRTWKLKMQPFYKVFVKLL